jgi:hypothetical protein
MRPIMKQNMYLLTATLMASTLLLAGAQGFDTGSDGSLGALNVEAADVTVDLPPDGRLHYTTVTVAGGRTLRFRRNALNTPVYLLAQGDVVINGTIDVSGSTAPGSPPIGGFGGPGGFDGGRPGFGASFPPGDGYGPGAGGAGTAGNDGSSAGGGGYGQSAGGASSNFRGGAYGSPLLIPLIGGSGGGGDAGTPGSGGGGGGGAILVASNTKIRVTGRIAAIGGFWRGSSHNGGSGGAIRLLAMRVEGLGEINVQGGSSGGAAGRIRVDCFDKTALQLNFQPLNLTTVGANMFVEPPVVPQLDIIAAAGQAIPVGTGDLVRVQLPFGSDTNQTITLQAKDFNADVPIRLTLTPDSGPRMGIETNLNNLAANPATVVIPVGLPANTLITVHAWTR